MRTLPLPDNHHSPDGILIIFGVQAILLSRNIPRSAADIHTVFARRAMAGGGSAHAAAGYFQLALDRNAISRRGRNRQRARAVN